MSLFGNKSSPRKDAEESPTRGGGGGLFGGGNNRPQGGGSLFPNLAQTQAEPQTEQPQPTGGLFGGGGGTGGGGLFGGGGRAGGLFAAGNTPQREEGLFANQAQAEQPRPAGGLFGGNRPQEGGAGGLFGGGGNRPQEGGAGGLFGGGGNRPQGGGGGLFGGGGGNRPQGAGGLFASPTQGQGQPQQPPAKPLNVHELQGNAPYNPNPSATNARGQGTVNLDLKFGKSADNYDIYSITCASNADKNKSIEELRAEDYELIRSGELPEDIQLKLIENREKLEKTLGFTLPVPTSTTATKNYTRVFKSQTRNGSMKSSFLSKKYSDVTFKVEDESIPAHRNILGTCSQHFDNLFAKHESNTIPLMIQIHDTKPEAFKAILEFLYCGEVNLYEELAAELLILAPRFDLNDLATGAEDFLTKVINADNYLRMLETSDRIGSKSLRKKVFAFIIKNMKVISKREDFEELPRPLLMEILENAITA